MVTNTNVKPTETHPTTADWRAILAAVVLIVIGIVIALLVPAPAEITVKNVDGLSVFAGFYILAQAIERFLEPWTGWSDRKKEEHEQAKKDHERTKEAAQTAKNKEQEEQCDRDIRKEEAGLKRLNASLVVLFWGLSSFIAMVVCSFLGLSLLAAAGMQVPSNLRWLDTVVTGMAVGGGTKGLHDLISLITKQKEQP